jgi:hypothetical protein
MGYGLFCVVVGLVIQIMVGVCRAVTDPSPEEYKRRYDEQREMENKYPDDFFTRR